MFERFTKEARAAVVSAQQVARDTGSRSIDTRHVLVALVEKPGPASDALGEAGADVHAVTAMARADLRAGGIDGDALADFGIDLSEVRRRADAVFGPEALERAARSRDSHLRFEPEARKALQLALREAIRLQQRSIRSSHLLLGILRADSTGRALLHRAGVDTDALRRALEAPRAA